MKKLLGLLLLVSISCQGAGLVNGTLSPINNGTNGGGGSGGATNGIQQLNGFGTNTTLVNVSITSGNGGGLTNLTIPVMDVTKPPFNAVGNNSTDDTAAFTNALAYSSSNGLPVFVPARTYFVQPFLVNSGESLVGESGSVLRFNIASATAYAIQTAYQGSNILISGLELEGVTNLTQPSSAPTPLNGLLIFDSSDKNQRIFNVYAHGFNEGVEMYQSSAPGLSSIHDLQSQFNYIGFQMDGTLQYNNFVNLTGTSDTVGLFDNSYNNCYSSCDFSFNGTNAMFTSTTVGHNTFQGCTFNHAGNYAVYANGVFAGEVFNGCMFLPTSGFITNSQGFLFNSSVMGWSVSGYSLTFDHSTNCSVLFPTTPYIGGFSALNVVATNACSNVITQFYGLNVDTNQNVTLPGTLSATGNISQGGTNLIAPQVGGTAGKVWTATSSGAAWSNAASGSGTVTSVTADGTYATGTVTTSGTFTPNLNPSITSLTTSSVITTGAGVSSTKNHNSAYSTVDPGSSGNTFSVASANAANMGMIISGGTVTSVVHNGTVLYTNATGLVDSYFPIPVYQSGESVTIWYSSKPTVFYRFF